MAKQNFDAIMDEVFVHEGGYVNHPKDPGGETNLGISKRSYPKEDIFGMTRARAKFLYWRDFWQPIKGDDLPVGVDLVTMDASINSGKTRGVRWIQLAAGLPKSRADGIMGPESLRAIKAADALVVIKKGCAIRMGYLRGLRTWGSFGNGWSKRVARVEAVAVAMAAKAEGSTGYVRKVLKDSGAAANVSRRSNKSAGHATATGGTAAGGGLEALHDLPTWAPVVFVAVVIVAAIWFYGRSRHDAHRAEAYKRELEKVV